MEIKLVKVKTFTETVTWNYGDDYSDVTRHIVTDHSGFEEVDQYNLNRIQSWVEEYNRKSKGEYFIIVDNKTISVEFVLNDIIKQENERIKQYEEQKRKDEERRELEKQNRAAKKLEKLKKQLAKAEKEAAAEKIG